MERLWQDLRFGARRVRKSPAYALVAILSLALGIMATTAIYSVIYGVIIDPFPYRDVDNLMSVRVWSPDERGSRTYYSTDQFLEIAERASIFEGVVASTISDVLRTDQAEPQRVRGNLATPNTFEVMGIPAMLGRTFSHSDVEPGSSPVVVLGYKFWQQQLAGDPAVLGRQMRLNDVTRTVVGVMPKRFMWRGADVYIPTVLRRGEAVEGVRFVHLLGRLKRGMTAAQAEADLQPIIADLKQREPDQFPDRWKVGLLSFKETFPSSIRDNLWVLFGAVALLLLIACANVSNLLLAKAAERRKEMTIRVALGAGRGRLVRQLLTESLLLAFLGGFLGVLLAFSSLPAILALVPPFTIPDESEVVLNTQVLLFALAVSGLTTIIFGLAPALQTATKELANPLRETGRSLVGSRRQSRIRNTLVIAEISLAFMLLVGAGLMIRSLSMVQGANFGFRVDRVLTMRVPLPENRYRDRDRRVGFFREVIQRIAALPGVDAVGVNMGLHPLGGMTSNVEVVGISQQNSRPVLVHHTNPDYLKAMGIAIMRGREMSPEEVEQRRQLALVNETFVRTRLTEGEALGRTVRVSRLKQPPLGLSDDAFEVIGIVRDTPNVNPREGVLPEIYIPYTLSGRAERVVVLTHSQPASMTKAILAQVYNVDGQQPITDLRPIERVLDEFVFAGPRFNVALFSIFASLGLMLAVIGVYGVMSSHVSQQKQEIGIRLALGARPNQIIALVIGRGLKLLFAGIGLGIIGSFVATQLLGGYLRNLSGFESLDQATVVAVASLLAVVALIACWIPSRRATKVDPLTVLRAE